MLRYFHPDSPLQLLAALILSGSALYLLLSAASYYYFFVWQRRRYHPGFVPDWKENRRAIRLSLWDVTGQAAMTVPFQYLLVKGYGHIYLDVHRYGWPYFFFSILLVLFFSETGVYWVHRWLHKPLPYRLFHGQHHSFRIANSWVSFAFHPFDAFIQALPQHLCALLFPVHIVVYLGFLFAISVWSVIIHDRVTFFRWKYLNNTGHHTVHHWFNKYNFGQFLNIWDRIGGTWRSEASLPEKLNHL